MSDHNATQPLYDGTLCDPRAEQDERIALQNEAHDAEKVASGKFVPDAGVGAAVLACKISEIEKAELCEATKGGQRLGGIARRLCSAHDHLTAALTAEQSKWESAMKWATDNLQGQLLAERAKREEAEGVGQTLRAELSRLRGVLADAMPAATSNRPEPCDARVADSRLRNEIKELWETFQPCSARRPGGKEPCDCGTCEHGVKLCEIDKPCIECWRPLNDEEAWLFALAANGSECAISELHDRYIRLRRGVEEATKIWSGSEVAKVGDKLFRAVPYEQSVRWLAEFGGCAAYCRCPLPEDDHDHKNCMACGKPKGGAR